MKPSARTKANTSNCCVENGVNKVILFSLIPVNGIAIILALGIVSLHLPDWGCLSSTALAVRAGHDFDIFVCELPQFFIVSVLRGPCAERDVRGHIMRQDLG